MLSSSSTSPVSSAVQDISFSYSNCWILSISALFSARIAAIDISNRCTFSLSSDNFCSSSVLGNLDVNKVEDDVDFVER